MAKAKTVLLEVPGGSDLCAWLGDIPYFGDTPLLDLKVTLDGHASVTLKTWPVDSGGRYIHEAPVLVTFSLEGLSHVEFDEFAASATLDQLVIERREDGFRLAWESAYGVQGLMEATQVTVSFRAGVA